ncbi:hypothetical protein RND71_002090 [Anisodus tanguticus]|uniref:Transketolase C-terminal domain-containing protein n=1 Tax=Anisodus tanguticus TaxID=243964 RepID=A0AAE1VRN0_9SOLA|nr:hypothetical protein RND71_002090 [Anisodus tanguticus]
MFVQISPIKDLLVLCVLGQSPKEAKGLLLSSIRDPNPVVFFEPKKIIETVTHYFLDESQMLYRMAVEEVPEDDYMLPLSEAEGAQLSVMEQACVEAAKEGISCELIDLKTLIPWDKETVEASVKKTGRLLVCILLYGIEEAHRELEAPVARVCGLDTPFPLVFEPFYLPTKNKVTRLETSFIFKRFDSDSD